MPNELDGADSASPAFGFHAIISMGWPAAHIEAVENITAKSTPKNDVLVTADMADSCQ